MDRRPSCATWLACPLRRSPSRRSNSSATNPRGLLSKLQSNPSETKYVSRGGYKLRGALDAFGVSAQGKVCLDVGSSTGGFTDCLLQAGARSVWAIDVGYGLLDYTLRKDPRVHVLERTNFRHFESNQLTEIPTLVTADVSFISLDKILPKIYQLLPPGGEAVVMVKPQFEATPKEAPGGVVKDEAVRERVMNHMREFSEKLGFKVKNTADSTLKGPKGNREAFLHLIKS